MINQLINLPTLNFADLALLFSKTSFFDAVKGFLVRISKPQFLLFLKVFIFFNSIISKVILYYSVL